MGISERCLEVLGSATQEMWETIRHCSLPNEAALSTSEAQAQPCCSLTHRLSPSVSVTYGAAPRWGRAPAAAAAAAAAAVAAATTSGSPPEEALLGAPLVLCRTMSVISLMAAQQVQGKWERDHLPPR